MDRQIFCPHCGTQKVEKNGNCATWNSIMRKAERQASKDADKLARKLLKQKESAKEPRKGVSKDPSKWKNTFLCSDGTKVTQAEINAFRSEAYAKRYPVQTATCHGCWKRKAQGSAHVIAQARCKQIGKTELIWNPDNFFPACLQCNSAIENPKGKNWKHLLYINKYLSFIKIHDPELFAKFENSAINQERQTI